MSKMKQLLEALEEAYFTDESPESVAERLGISTEMVEDAWYDIEAAAYSIDECDGQPDEAQEWNDFDPDC
jgi:hypothetical protein